MAKSIEQGFGYFLQRLVPLSSERNKGIIHKSAVRSCLAKNFGCSGFFETVSPKDKNMLVFGITNTIKKAFSSSCKEASVKEFRFHDCRHTATTRMIASGSPHTEVMKITGHTQLKTFLRYLNTTQETANNVASRLSNYLTQKQTEVDAFSQVVN
jgi:integrase